MFTSTRSLTPLADRGPLRVMFVLTGMPVGGAEVLLVNLIRRLDRERFAPELCCLKWLGALGEELAKEIPTHTGLINSKFDLRIWGRLTRLLQQRRIDAVVTVGGGDKMFWGRLAAWRAGVPVVASALHSTGWPDGVTRLNRWLTPLTDAFIAVATEHGRFLVEKEKFPLAKVHVIPNGVDVDRFQPCPEHRVLVRRELGLALDAPVGMIVAALRPEKNHSLFLQSAARVIAQLPAARFVIVGDGPERARLESEAATLGVQSQVQFLGNRSDIPRLLAAADLFALTSDNEANPVSILEAMAMGLPVVATHVGSIAESVLHGETGLLVPTRDADAASSAWLALLGNREMSVRMGRLGRERVITHWSLQRMVNGYQDLLSDLYERKCRAGQGCRAGAKPNTITHTVQRPE